MTWITNPTSSQRHHRDPVAWPRLPRWQRPVILDNQPPGRSPV